MVDLPRHFVEIQHHLNKMHKLFFKLSSRIVRLNIRPPFHREVRHLQVVEIVVKNFSMMGCDQGATTPSYWAGRLA